MIFSVALLCIKFPHGPVVFTQKVTVVDYSQPITGYLEFMTCDNERCLPPTEVDFKFSVEKTAAVEKTKEEAPKDDRSSISPASNNASDRQTGSTEETIAEEEVPTENPNLISASATETIPDDGLLHL